MAVLAFNYDQIIPAFISIFSEVFSGSAATGGFLGASVIYAFNRGVNRGLFSNEAGQGSAPIAHAAARTKEPISEGIVAILEPFIDTIIICTLTGLVLLSSGVWKEKLPNEFHRVDMSVIDGSYSENDSEDLQLLYNHLNNKKSLKAYTGALECENGELNLYCVTLIVS